MYTQKGMRKALLCLAAIMVLLVVSAAQMGPPPLPPGVEEKIVSSCPSEVAACGPFADSTTVRPTTVCCEPLESVIANNVSCLCLLFGDEEVIEAFKIDVPKAITLPQRCGLQPFDLSSNCQGLMAPSTAPSMSSANAPVSGSIAPSESPLISTIANAPVSGQEDSGTTNIAWTGSGVMGSFLLCATLIFY